MYSLHQRDTPATTANASVFIFLQCDPDDTVGQQGTSIAEAVVHGTTVRVGLQRTFLCPSTEGGSPPSKYAASKNVWNYIKDS